MHTKTSGGLTKWPARALRALTAVALAVGAVAITPSTAHAAASRGFAYVWANQPTAALNTPYTPSGYYSRNSTGVVNSVVRTGTGQYTVRLPRLGLTGGTVHVTAYGATSHSCNVASWHPVGDRLDVHVRCYTPSGYRANTPFTTSFVNTAYRGGRFGHVWADQPSTGAYTASRTYQFNSAGYTNTVTRSGLGRYTVRLPAIGSAAGHVQVTAYGDVLARCKAVNWYPSGTAQLVNVRCFTLGGALRDTRFTMTYARDTGILRTTPAAYAWANQPTASSYYPSAAYRYNSAGYTNRITRHGVGVYRVSTPGMSLGYGDVQVTAYGGDSRHCKVDYWTPSTGIQVRCFTASGAPADTYYDVSFVR
ncbi:hypothetical protein [Streptomyces purpureus]|uniref:Uncharacterized protein n=1 Tax=Streptomyces purpureus TaxID=1951 RepID=A0A918LM81_9ACTN|nr:hypothetical protein [Streptomyces purpureus]GGT16569.1 hypothetical protein GCM10014713_06830 [Streptomyces purpureus]